MTKPNSAPARPAFFPLQNGEHAELAFTDAEYAERLAGLRTVLVRAGVDAVLLTSQHNIAYFSGFLYCEFGRPYGCVVTADECVTISANIDYGQPWRHSYGDNLVYTDWQQDNYWRAVRHVIPAGTLGIEGDHLTLLAQEKLHHYLAPAQVVELSAPIMQLRMLKSPAELALIKGGACIADLAGEAMRAVIQEGAREIDVAMVGRDTIERAIADEYPASELRDSWVWFQSGVNTDGAHNPVTTRKLQRGDILSLNAFPMISGYYTALERTLFVTEADPASLALWEANVAAHELGLSLIAPGIACRDICARLNDYFAEHDLLQYRTFGYGHSFGMLSHYYGREAGLELREDNPTVLQENMVVSMEPMLTVPAGQPGGGGYREHDILVVTADGAENITHFPYGPTANIV